MEAKTYQEMELLGGFFVWMEKHPIISNIILTVECIALVLAVLFYDFTTHI